MKCNICEKNEAVQDNMCQICDDMTFILDEIINNYLKGAIVDPAIVGALGNFSWIYAGYPRLWGFYNSIINVVYHFIMYPSKKHITERELKISDFSTVQPAIIIDVLLKCKILETFEEEEIPTFFKPGLLTQIVVERIRNELFTNKIDKSNRKRFKRAAQEMFGITSIMLTKILLKKKLDDRANQLMPRKSLAVFLTLVKIIRNNFSEGSKIKKKFTKDLMDEMQALIKVSKDGRNRILLEMLGLSYITPGKTNIISNVDTTHKVYILNNETLNLLENLRERIRERDRERERVR